MHTDGVTNKELAENYFFDTDVDRITKTFALKSEKLRNDDTTLIALRYDNR